MKFPNKHESLKISPRTKASNAREPFHFHLMHDLMNNHNTLQDVSPFYISSRRMNCLGPYG